MTNFINKDSKGNALGRNFAKYILEELIEDGAKLLSTDDVKLQDNLVCLVEMSNVSNAIYISTQEEFDLYDKATMYKSKRWLIYPNAKSGAGIVK